MVLRNHIQIETERTYPSWIFNNSHFVVKHTHKHVFNKPTSTDMKDNAGGQRTRTYHHQGRRRHLEKQNPKMSKTLKNVGPQLGILSLPPENKS